MKTKGMILALVAIVFAVGSAFTSKNVNMAGNVKIWIQQTEQSSFVCTAIDRTCAQAPTGSLCEVTVTKLSGSTETVNAYGALDIPACSVQLRHEVGNAFVAPYDPSSRPFDVKN
jgi:hypothetical protein